MWVRTVYKVMTMVVITLILSYFGGCLFYIFSQYGNSAEDIARNNTFITIKTNKRWISLEEETHTTTKAITMTYFMLTTMTAIGYGDLMPISDNEKIVGIILFLLGHVFVIYVLSTFRSILDDIEKISAFNMKRKSMEADEIAL